MPNVRQRVELLPYTTFRMGGVVSYFADLNSKEEVAEYANFAASKGLPLIIIGGGSNIIFPDKGELRACVGRMSIKGFEIISRDSESATLKIGAGENWDSVVKRAVDLRLQGIEALASIPGSAGATPVQNVGAYGQEIADTLVKVEVYDLIEQKVKEMSKDECQFSYRDSIFKREGKNRYIILSLTLKLYFKEPTMPAYPGVEAYFSKKGITKPTLKEIRDGVSEIRQYKLPDPKDIASCGSFFKNPIVGKEVAERIKKEYPNAVTFKVSEVEYKIGAGWMIDTLGLKGKDFGTLMTYPNNALVIVNKGGATREELQRLVKTIETQVKNTFGVTLEPEPVFIS